MINIVEFFPLYREVNRITSAVALDEAMSYADQKTITDFYRQFSDAVRFESSIVSSCRDGETERAPSLQLDPMKPMEAYR